MKESITIDYDGQHYRMGVWKGNVWHYCELPDKDSEGYQLGRTAVKTLIDTMAARVGKSNVGYTISYTTAAAARLDVADIFSK